MHTEDRVVVTDVKIPFWSMVVLLVKWAIAAIPAMLILIGLLWAMSIVFNLLPMTWGWWSGRGTV